MLVPKLPNLVALTIFLTAGVCFLRCFGVRLADAFLLTLYFGVAADSGKPSALAWALTIEFFNLFMSFADKKICS